jgi:response regulator RpfG family c-di-GMP phosphodiesterase
MNGIEFLVQVESLAPDTVRIMLTGNADQKTARDAVNQGHIFRFLTKPCPQEEMAPALRAGLNQYRLITAERDVLERTLNGSAKVLSDILAVHDAHAFGQSQRLREYMRAFAEHLKFKQTWDLELAAMLSKIGCVTIPQAVLERARAGRMLSGPEADMMARVPAWNRSPRSSVIKARTSTARVFHGTLSQGRTFPSAPASCACWRICWPMKRPGRPRPGRWKA